MLLTAIGPDFDNRSSLSHTRLLIFTMTVYYNPCEKPPNALYNLLVNQLYKHCHSRISPSSRKHEITKRNHFSFLNRGN
jgi:hypothetical protein